MMNFIKFGVPPAKSLIGQGRSLGAFQLRASSYSRHAISMKKADREAPRKFVREANERRRLANRRSALVQQAAPEILGTEAVMKDRAPLESSGFFTWALRRIFSLVNLR